MTKADKKKLQRLMDHGFKVVLRDLDGKTFNDRYDVYQTVGWEHLRMAVVEEDGRVTALQG